MSSKRKQAFYSLSLCSTGFSRGAGVVSSDAGNAAAAGVVAVVAVAAVATEALPSIVVPLLFLGPGSLLLLLVESGEDEAEQVRRGREGRC